MTACTQTIYPSVINRACAALDESPIFRDLPDGYLRVVVRVIKKINLARLKSPIVASRGTLAEESGKSVETVQRAVKWLEDRGLVQREQKARAGLRGSSSPLVPTDTLLEALQLKGGKAHDQEHQPSVDKSAPSPVTADISISTGPKNTVSLRKQPDGPGAFARIDGFAVPTELAWLCKQNGLKVSAVLGLMKLCKQVGQRLANVVAVTRKYIEDLRGRELYAYLRKLITANKDYGKLVQLEATEHESQQKRERLAQKSIELVGRRFRTRDESVLVFIEQNGLLTDIRNGIRRCGPLSEGFLEALENGRLIPC